jgi:hypothetical protein
MDPSFHRRARTRKLGAAGRAEVVWEDDAYEDGEAIPAP